MPSQDEAGDVVPVPGNEKRKVPVAQWKVSRSADRWA